MSRYYLEIVVFLAGMGIMVFELIGSRVLAPYVGTTIIVWSALIGTVLVFLSAGYMWGGWFADKRPTNSAFSIVIFASAVFVTVTALLKTPIILFIDQYFTSLQWEAMVLSIVLFGPASFFMAAASPFAVRLRIESVEESGATVGRLSSIAAIGSIVGAFSSGMILAPLIGNTAILLSLAAILFFASILAHSRSWMAAKVVVLLVVLSLPLFSDRIDQYFLPIDFIESSYTDIAVLESAYRYKDPISGEVTNRSVRELNTGPQIVQSAFFIDHEEDLALPYSEFFRVLPEFFNPKVERALLIGGAGYSIPKDFLIRNKTGEIDVVEIDPKMTEVAVEFFGLDIDNPRLTVYHEDGRTYLNRTGKKYDVVMIDAFRSFSPPFQLATLEMAEEISRVLSDDGVVLINMQQSIEGETGEFFRAEYKTFGEVFPQQYVFRALSPDPEAVQNLILVSTKSDKRAALISDDSIVNSYLQKAWTGPVGDDAQILTDDFAPVSHYMLAASEVLK